ncbi:hypothetical protein SCFA_170017 [anaerobic digester metagenome]|uniref:Uncharacterized protein n=1 Tax=anaerobic digester metagenome TaxID=1263854 RepID=A0A485LXE1_9ZZZZ
MQRLVLAGYTVITVMVSFGAYEPNQGENSLEPSNYGCLHNNIDMFIRIMYLYVIDTSVKSARFVRRRKYWYFYYLHEPEKRRVLDGRVS